MALELFGFIEEVLEELEERREDLEEISKEIGDFFEETLRDAEKGYLNISTRVKGSNSLKEKMIRNQYYPKYKTKELLFQNVSDIIGVRIECRFIQDEADLYKYIKRFFSEKSELDNELYFSSKRPNILLNLADKQPQEQKNGMKIYRIDGKYLEGELSINFEVQIKSLVNVFWGEIEHKVIYKNFNYVIADKFFKDIMKSIKNSLSTIDQQLLLISNQFAQGEEDSYASQEEEMEKLLSKIIYDIFAVKMRESIGVLVDFKKSCEAIVKYVFREPLGKEASEHSELIMTGFEKVRGIDRERIDFKQKLKFDNDPRYEDAYTEIIGRHIQDRINEEFQWNLFFRILFAIEPENNRRDFEKFIHYYSQKIYSRINESKLSSNFTEEETKEIIRRLMLVFSKCFVKIDSVELLYDSMLEQALKQINCVTEAIYKNVLTYEQWEKEKKIYIDLLEVRLLMMFNIEVDANKVLAVLDGIRITKSNIEVPKGMIKYIYKLG